MCPGTGRTFFLQEPVWRSRPHRPEGSECPECFTEGGWHPRLGLLSANALLCFLPQEESLSGIGFPNSREAVDLN